VRKKLFTFSCLTKRNGCQQIRATLTTFPYHRNGKRKKGPGLLRNRQEEKKEKKKGEGTMSGEDQIVPALLCIILHCC